MGAMCRRTRPAVRVLELIAAREEVTPRGRASQAWQAPRRAHTQTQVAWELCLERRRSGALPWPAAARWQTLNGAGALTRGRGIMVREVLDSGEEAHTWLFPQKLQPRRPLQEVPTSSPSRVRPPLAPQDPTPATSSHISRLTSEVNPIWPRHNLSHGPGLRGGGRAGDPMPEEATGDPRDMERGH